MQIKKIFRQLFSPHTRRKFKTLKRHVLTYFNRSNKISLEQMRSILIEEIGLKQGDRIIVSSSFGNLNADFSPKELIELMQEIVTTEGLIMMPFYPPMNSYEWAKGDNVFDMQTTKSGMGVMTNVFSSMPDVIKSVHPTKAVCVWGKEAASIAQDHENSTTPFYWDSPYGKLLKNKSKSVCLGLSNIPIFHAIEDILSSDYTIYYQKEKYSLPVRLYDGQIVRVSTYVHDPKVLDNAIQPREYVYRLNIPSYKRLKVGHKFIVSVRNDDVFEYAKRNFKIGRNRLKK